jgi:transcriptional regulator with PAS, ATPase and Fis domain
MMVDAGAGAVDQLCGFITRSPRMQRVLDLIRRFAELDTPVLVQGETGTGKELVARALHALKTPASGPFMVVDCGSLPESIVESELFGYEKGAFTGADRSYTGRIQAAAGGTLFLDEVNSISIAMQAKLLRFLEDGAFSRIGQPRPVPVSVRLISASNVPLEELITSGRMRPDFFYRLNVLRIDLPPLRERLEDLPLLVGKFLHDDAIARRCGATDVRPEVLDRLCERPWRGNVRELYNVLRRAVVLCAENGVIQRLPDRPEATPDPPAPETGRVSRRFAKFRSWMREREREYLAALVKHYRSVTEQAVASGLPQRTLYRKIRRLALRPVGRPDERAAEPGAPAAREACSSPPGGD